MGAGLSFVAAGRAQDSCLRQRAGVGLCNTLRQSGRESQPSVWLRGWQHLRQNTETNL